MADKEDKSRSPRGRRGSRRGNDHTEKASSSCDEVFDEEVNMQVMFKEFRKMTREMKSFKHQFNETISEVRKELKGMRKDIDTMKEHLKKLKSDVDKNRNYMDDELVKLRDELKDRIQAESNAHSKAENHPAIEKTKRTGVVRGWGKGAEIWKKS